MKLTLVSRQERGEIRGTEARTLISAPPSAQAGAGPARSDVRRASSGSRLSTPRASSRSDVLAAVDAAAPDSPSAADVIARAERRLGTLLAGKFRLESLIGVGGMASVFSAVHTRNGNRVAIKLLHPELASSAFVRAQFLDEGYVANSVGHPGSVRVLDDDTTEDGLPFLVMELLEGETLGARWERRGRRMDACEVATILSALLDVLAAAHEGGTVHRDIAPANVFLTVDGAVKVLDFGLASRGVAARAAGTGCVLGTPAFMAPEQACGRIDEVDARSDLWAVGALAFMLLSGHHVHEAQSAFEILALTATEQPPSLLDVAPDVSPAVAAVVDRALALERSNRWGDARTMKEALARSTPRPHVASPERVAKNVRPSAFCRAWRRARTRDFLRIVPRARRR